MNHIDCTYNIPYSGMPVPMCERLSEAFRTLPEFRAYDKDECPVWFGFEEDGGAFLWASVEPSGLHVQGCLEDADWKRWEASFLTSASAILGFQVKDADE